MRRSHVCFALILVIAAGMSSLWAQGNPEIYEIEGFPPEVQAAIEQRDRALRQAPKEVDGNPFQYVFTILTRWAPTGQNATPVITVAFKGGDDLLRRDIANTASEWSNYGGVKFDFVDPATGRYREWSSIDTQYRGDIRVSFDQSGFWSVVGNESIDRNLVPPGKASMNFAKFDENRPTNWKTVVRHEFGHAIGLQHEHQSPNGGCGSDFRWNDDPGYTPSTDSHGQYRPDQNGKRPGLYTVLGGPLNNWPKSVVDFNLKPLDNSSRAYDAGTFDEKSIMKYYFPAWMFVQGTESHCYGPENFGISPDDRVAIAKWYPQSPQAWSSILATRRRFLTALVQANFSTQQKQQYVHQLEQMK
jgi:hypothetical protein